MFSSNTDGFMNSSSTLIKSEAKSLPKKTTRGSLDKSTNVKEVFNYVSDCTKVLENTLCKGVKDCQLTEMKWPKHKKKLNFSFTFRIYTEHKFS